MTKKEQTEQRALKILGEWVKELENELFKEKETNMKIVKIKILAIPEDKDRWGQNWYSFQFNVGEEKFAIDAGDYYLVQSKTGYDFTWVFPKGEVKPAQTTKYCEEI